jgi:hypothetical protein
MKAKDLVLRAALAAALAWSASLPCAAQPEPAVTLGISGTLFYTTNNDTAQMGIPLKRLNYTGQTLIKLLNSSSNATNTLQQVTGRSQIPAGSHFLWNISEDSLTITNQDGFSFPLQGDGYLYGYLDVDYGQFIGTYRLNSKTAAGTETDVTGIYFYFYDDNENFNQIKLLGTATLNWAYGKAKNGSQKALLSVTMQGCGNDESYVDGHNAIATSFVGLGASTNSVASTSVPFYSGY